MHIQHDGKLYRLDPPKTIAAAKSLAVNLLAIYRKGKAPELTIAEWAAMVSPYFAELDTVEVLALPDPVIIDAVKKLSEPPEPKRSLLSRFF